MTNTSELRRLWGPPCQGPFVKLALHGEGVVSVKASAATAFRALNDVLIKHDYKTRRADTGGYNCRKITGGDGYSLHAYAIAIDVNWLSNPYGPRLITDMPRSMIEDIEAIRTKSGHAVFRWGGRYAGNKDAMHFEIICSPAQLATGIRPSTTEPGPVPISEENDEMLPGYDKSAEDVARATVRELCDKHWGYGKMNVNDQNWLVGEWAKLGRENMMTKLLDHPKAAKGPGV